MGGSWMRCAARAWGERTPPHPGKPVEKRVKRAQYGQRAAPPARPTALSAAELHERVPVHTLSTVQPYVLLYRRL